MLPGKIPRRVVGTGIRGLPRPRRASIPTVAGIRQFELLSMSQDASATVHVRAAKLPVKLFELTKPQGRWRLAPVGVGLGLIQYQARATA